MADPGGDQVRVIDEAEWRAGLCEHSEQHAFYPDGHWAVFAHQGDVYTMLASGSTPDAYDEWIAARAGSATGADHG